MERFKTGELLGKSSRLMSNKLSNELNRQHIELTPEQWMVLHTLVDGSKSQKEICEITLKNKASINSLISSLTKFGLVMKTTLDSDKRHNVITITEKGITVKNQANTIALDTLELMLDGFSKSEVANLNNYLARIKENLIR